MKLLKKIIYSTLSLPIALLPSGVFYGLWMILRPATFWQKLLSIVLGCIFFAPIQFWLLLIYLAFIIGSRVDAPESPTQYVFKNRLKQYE